MCSRHFLRLALCCGVFATLNLWAQEDNTVTATDPGNTPKPAAVTPELKTAIDQAFASSAQWFRGPVPGRTGHRGGGPVCGLPSPGILGQPAARLR